MLITLYTTNKGVHRSHENMTNDFEDFISHVHIIITYALYSPIRKPRTMF